MPTVYEQLFQLVPLQDEEPWVSVEMCLKEWLRRRWPRDQEFPRLSFEESVVVDDDAGSRYRWHPYEGPEGRVGELIYSQANPSDDMSWETRVLFLWSPERGSRLRIRVENSGPSFGAPGFRHAAPPRLPFLLAGRVRVRTSDLYSVRFEVPVLATTSSVRDLVRTTLFDPRREHPVLVVTAGADGRWPVPLEDVARQFGSVAEVYGIHDLQSMYSLQDELGAEKLAVYRGAARVYLPGLNRTSDPFAHPLILEPRWQGLARRQVLEQDLALLTVARSRQDPETRRLLDARARRAAEREAENRLAALHAQALVNPDADAKEELYLEEIRRLERVQVQQRAEIEQWTDEVERLEKERGRLVAKLVYFESRFGVADAAEGRSGVLRAASTVEELVSLAAEHYPDTLRFLPRARTSAAECAFLDVESVRIAFESMHLAAVRQAEEGGLGQGLYEWFDQQGITYASHIAETTPARLRRQYEVPDENGVVHVCHGHFKFGRSFDPRECLRIYVNPDMERHRFVIGWITQHAETIQTN